MNSSISVRSSRKGPKLQARASAGWVVNLHFASPRRERRVRRSARSRRLWLRFTGVDCRVTRFDTFAPAYLLLEDGRRFDGIALGAHGVALGEVVFNTAMTGYQEILTDPSYTGQLVTMTYPLIGNYGVNDEDRESPLPSVAGFIVREASRLASSWRSNGTLQD